MQSNQRSAIFFGQECFDALTSTASNSPRRRTNLDFHDSASHPAHRFLNAVEPDSYIRPHRHRDRFKEETFVVLRGAFGMVLFDDEGNVSDTALICAHGELIGAHIPIGVFHSLVSLEPGSVFFEVKAGPYDPRTAKDWGEWSPVEGHPDAPAYLARLRSLFL